MATMNISLPAEMKEWVESQTKTGDYANASDYVRDLIRKDKIKQAKIENMQKLVDEGRNSGISGYTMDDILRIAKARV